MKYIKLFEAFESDAITNTLKFLTKKLNKSQARNFMHSFQKLMTEFDIPLSKVGNDSIDYFRTSKAVNIQSDKEVDNKNGIYCIKYWFSLENGYLGETGTGNLKTKYRKLVRDYSEINENFNAMQYRFIENNLGITTGTITSVLDYSVLKTGDYVIIVLGSENRSDNDGLVLGRVFVGKDDEDKDRIYVYQNRRHRGPRPNSEPDFAENYTNCYNIGTLDNIDRDHFRLHIYKEGKKELTRKEGKKPFREKYTPNPGDINKRISYNYNVRLEDWTFDNQSGIHDIIEESDFAVIVYLDKLLDNETRSDINRSKQEARVGATALLSDKEIRLINIDRLSAKLINKYGIEQDKTDFTKLSNIVNTTLCNQFIIFSLCTGNGLPGLTNITENLYKLVEDDEDGYSDKKYAFSRVLRYFKENRKTSEAYNNIYRDNLKLVNELGNERTIAIIERIVDLGKKTNILIKNLTMETINDVIMLQHKLKTLENFIDDERYKTSYRYNSIIYSFDRSIEYDITRANESETEETFTRSMAKLDVIERFINDILK